MPVLDLEKVIPQLEQFLGQVVELARFDLQFLIQTGPENHLELEGADLVVDFSGRDTDLLLERGGALLGALEYMVIKALRLPPAEHGKIAFDCCDYKALRVDELRLTAETAAERVARTGAPFPLNPMDSRERRIIHLALREYPAVRTESQGSGPYRKVVIFPAEKK